MFPWERSWMNDLRQCEDYAQNTGNVNRGEQGGGYRDDPGRGNWNPMTWNHGRDLFNLQTEYEIYDNHINPEFFNNNAHGNNASFFSPADSIHEDRAGYGGYANPIGDRTQNFHQYPYNPGRTTGHENYASRASPADFAENMFRSNIGNLRQNAVPLVSVHVPSGYHINANYGGTPDNATGFGAARATSYDNPTDFAGRMPVRPIPIRPWRDPVQTGQFDFHVGQGNPAYHGEHFNRGPQSHGHSNCPYKIYAVVRGRSSNSSEPVILDPPGNEINLGIYNPWQTPVTHQLKVSWNKKCHDTYDIVNAKYSLTCNEMGWERSLCTINNNIRVDHPSVVYNLLAYYPIKPKSKIILFSDLYGMGFLGRIIEFRYYDYRLCSHLVYKGTTEMILSNIKEKTRRMTIDDAVIIFCGPSDFGINSAENVVRRIDNVAIFLAFTNVIICNMVRCVNAKGGRYNAFVDEINKKLENRYAGLKRVFVAKLNEAVSDGDFRRDGYRLKLPGLRKIAEKIYDLYVFRHDP